VIKLEDISRVYGQGSATTHALRSVNLDIPDGSFVTVVGTSGSGKTTLLNIIGGLDTEYTGRATIGGQDLKKLSDREQSRFRNQSVGFVFQHFMLLEHLDALANVALPSFFSDNNNKNNLERAEEVLVRVGLKDKLHQLPSQLSGGQKQRVAIARALFFRPKLILADEPTGNLDTKTGRQIISLFESLNVEEKLCIVVVTHEDFLFKHASHTLHMEDGQLVDEKGE
jgi:ABC-type lipoprotein export system ATPase subunit